MEIGQREASMDLLRGPRRSHATSHAQTTRRTIRFDDEGSEQLCFEPEGPPPLGVSTIEKPSSRGYGSSCLNERPGLDPSEEMPLEMSKGQSEWARYALGIEAG